MAGRKKRPRDCPLCSRPLSRFFISMEEAVRMCPSVDCSYPFDQSPKELSRLIAPIDFSMDKVPLPPHEDSAKGIPESTITLPEGKRGRHLATIPQELLLGLPSLQKKRRPAIRPPKGVLCTIENIRSHCTTVLPEKYTLAIQLPPSHHQA